MARNPVSDAAFLEALGVRVRLVTDLAERAIYFPRSSVLFIDGAIMAKPWEACAILDKIAALVASGRSVDLVDREDFSVADLVDREAVPDREGVEGVEGASE